MGSIIRYLDLFNKNGLHNSEILNLTQINIITDLLSANSSNVIFNSILIEILTHSCKEVFVEDMFTKESSDANNRMKVLAELLTVMTKLLSESLIEKALVKDAYELVFIIIKKFLTEGTQIGKKQLLDSDFLGPFAEQCVGFNAIKAIPLNELPVLLGYIDLLKSMENYRLPLNKYLSHLESILEEFFNNAEAFGLLMDIICNSEGSVLAKIFQFWEKYTNFSLESTVEILMHSRDKVEIGKVVNAFNRLVTLDSKNAYVVFEEFLSINNMSDSSIDCLLKYFEYRRLSA